jgi:hypothetical protein
VPESRTEGAVSALARRRRHGSSGWRRSWRRLTNRPNWRWRRWQILAVLLLVALTVAFYAYLFGVAA